VASNRGDPASVRSTPDQGSLKGRHRDPRRSEPIGHVCAAKFLFEEHPTVGAELYWAEKRHLSWEGHIRLKIPIKSIRDYYLRDEDGGRKGDTLLEPRPC